MQENTRRNLLKAITSIPILGGAMMAFHTVIRYFKPTMAGGIKGLMAPPDEAGSAEQVVADLGELAKPWDSKEFIYIRKSVEYSDRKIQGAKIPCYIVRIPDEFAVPGDEKSKFVVVQRICPHLGCTFNFVPDPQALAGTFNYTTPQPTHPYFACPCHLSVYDPTRKQAVEGQSLPGKVVSGPAPRPPRTMSYEIRGTKIVITGTESGGVG